MLLALVLDIPGRNPNALPSNFVYIHSFSSLLFLQFPVFFFISLFNFLIFRVFRLPASLIKEDMSLPSPHHPGQSKTRYNSNW